MIHSFTHAVIYKSIRNMSIRTHSFSNLFTYSHIYQLIHFLTLSSIYFQFHTYPYIYLSIYLTYASIYLLIHLVAHPIFTYPCTCTYWSINSFIQVFTISFYSSLLHSMYSSISNPIHQYTIKISIHEYVDSGIISFIY